MEFGERLKKLRIEKGLTQDELALRIHVARQTIGKWENGVSFPSLEMINVLSRELGTSANELLGQEKINDIVLAEAGERKKDKKKIWLGIGAGAASLGVAALSLGLVLRNGAGVDVGESSSENPGESVCSFYAIPWISGFSVGMDEEKEDDSYRLSVGKRHFAWFDYTISSPSSGCIEDLQPIIIPSQLRFEYDQTLLSVEVDDDESMAGFFLTPLQESKTTLTVIYHDFSSVLALNAQSLPDSSPSGSA